MKKTVRRMFCGSGLGLLLVLGAGCATLPYPASVHVNQDRYPALAPDEPQVEWGRPHAFVDGLGWLAGIPSKIILWDRRVDNHRIQPETVEVLERYLGINEMARVKVRVNQYHPSGEWRRVFQNKAVGAGWRYTFGILSALSYTILPQRVFGGDNYNPYSHTINLYSDVPAIAVHEGGHAKDFSQRRFKGTYAAIYMLPVIPLHHERVATDDALGYLQTHEDPALLQEGYRLLYPAYGTYVGGVGGLFLKAPHDLVFYAGSVVSGHAIGRSRARRVPEGGDGAGDGPRQEE